MGLADGTDAGDNVTPPSTKKHGPHNSSHPHQPSSTLASAQPVPAWQDKDPNLALIAGLDPGNMVRQREAADGKITFEDKEGHFYVYDPDAEGIKTRPAGSTSPTVDLVSASGAKATQVVDPNAPAWHQNPSWAAPTQELTDQIKTKNPNILSYGNVIETRPTDDGTGAVILRMSDGSYMRYDPKTGASTGSAGSWNKDQWDAYQAQTPMPPATTPTPPTLPAPPNPIPDKVIPVVLGGTTQTPASLANSGLIDPKDIPVVTVAPKPTAPPGGPTGGPGWRPTPEEHGQGHGHHHDDGLPGGGGNNDRGESHHDDSASSAGLTDPTAAVKSGGFNDLSVKPTDVIGLPSGFVDPGSAGTGGCFPAGTMVLTPEGSRPIEDIQAGDQILTYSLHDKQTQPAKVKKPITHEPEATLIITTDTGSITTTAEHRFWSGHDWLPADKLKPGAKLFNHDQKLISVITIEPGPTTAVYNLHIDSPSHNYFAEGYLVHNSKMVGM